MRKYIVNNQEVRNLDIQEKDDGTIVVTFEDKLNILKVETKAITRKLRENGITGCHLINHEIKYKLFIIKLKSIDQLTGVLHVLEIPHGCYEVNYEDAEIIIDTPDYERLVVGVNIVKSEGNVCEEGL